MFASLEGECASPEELNQFLEENEAFYLIEDNMFDFQNLSGQIKTK